MIGGEDNLKEIISLIQNKKVLFITTKNLDYIRISQECNLLEETAKKYDTIGSYSKNYPKRILKVWFSLLFKSVKEYDIIFVGFMPQLVLPLFKWKFKNKILLIDFFISIFDTLVDDRKKVKEGTSKAKLLKKIDRSTLRTANYVITDTRAHGRYFSKEFGVENRKVKVWYLEADTKYYRPMNTERPDYLKDKFVVLYFGSILPVQGVEIILETTTLLEQREDIHFLIIGPISKKIDRPETKNVTYIDWLPQEQLAQYISLSDLCLAGHFSDKIGKANRTIPGKVYIYLAMKKKVVLGDSEANRELFDEIFRQDVVYVKRGDAHALADKIVFEKEKKYNAL